jgi:lysophospholipase L1-like esterase
VPCPAGLHLRSGRDIDDEAAEGAPANRALDRNLRFAAADLVVGMSACVLSIFGPGDGLWQGAPPTGARAGYLSWMTPAAHPLPPFDRYLALGDSLSIDHYPARATHAAGAQAEPAELTPGLGAATLLYRNDDLLWPEFAGLDLVTANPRISFRNLHVFDHPAEHPTDHLATDGATTVGVLAYQLHRVPPSAERLLVTVTAGRSDVFQMMGAPRPPATLVAGMLSRAERLVRTVRERLPNAVLLLTTAPDPSDGLGQLDEDTPFAREAGWLTEYNGGLAELASAAASPHVLLADAAAHFAGHGLSAPADERWYWSGRITEPNARGASELRRVWAGALRALAR